ncbi:MAG: hypothetical protein J5626_01395 [Lachnospiraceae bacterium]|nr:hypothetical protein [Lachnospiraceae bacterium]
MTLKKLLPLLLLLILTVLIVTSCGGRENSANVTTENIKESVEILTTTEVGFPKTEPEPESAPDPESEDYIKIKVSDWGYENIEYVNQKFLLALKDNKWILVSAHTGKQVRWPFKYEDDTYEAEFDSVYMNLQSGCFIGVIAEDDGTFTSALFDPEAEIIRFKLHKNQGSIVDYRDNLIIAETKGKNDTDYYYIISIKDGEYGYTAYQKKKLSFLRSSYGILNLSFNTFYTDIKTCGWRFNSYDVRDYIDDKAEDKGKLLEYAESVNNLYGDKAVQVWPNTDNKEGWVRASVFDVGEDNYGSPRFLKDTGKAGFYNLLTQDFIETPDDSSTCIFFMTENGSPKCTVSDSRAAIAVKIDELSGDDEDNLAYRIFDLRTKDWAGEALYPVIKSFGYHKYVRVQNIDGKWSFIDDETMKPVGESYELASDFCNGYAVVIKDQIGYLIDENLKQVSEEFEAKGVGAALDYLEFSDLDGRSVFFVQKEDGLFHMLTIEE